MKYIHSLGHIDLKRKYKVREILLVVLLFVAIMVPIVRNAIRANSLSDTTPPQLLSLSAASNAVDTSNAPATVTINGTYSDDLSGFGSGYFHYTSPSGGQVLEGTLTASGQNLSGSVTFPQYAETGTWTATVTMYDQSTNAVSYTATQLNPLGNSTITVSSSPSDTTAPVLTSMQFDTQNIDATLGAGYLHGTATFTEDFSGYNMDLTQLVFHSPNGQQSCASVLTPTPNNNYSLDTIFPDFSQVGDWNITLTMTDNAGNIHFYDSSELATMGLPSVIHVTGPNDVTPPIINFLEFSASNPLVDQNAYPHSSVVTVRGDFTDDMSAFAYGVMTYTSPSGNQTAPFVEGGADPFGWQYSVYIPPYAESGLWKPTFTIRDRTGNVQTFSYTDLQNMGYDLGIQVGDIQQATATANGSVSTDVDNTGATSTTPFVASVQTPIAGDVTISQVSVPNPVSSNNYQFFSKQYDIVAPAATVEAPLQLSFTVDASQLGGLTAANLQIFRNGVVADDCTDPVMAVPDPCVSNRTGLPNGDAQITVRSSHASIWSLAHKAVTGPAYSFKNFKGTKPAPVLNSAEGGSTVPIKFDLGGNFGTNVLPATIAQSQQINCTSKTTIGLATDINTVGNGLKITQNSSDDDNEGEDGNSGHGSNHSNTPQYTYQFNWKTLKNWKKTCRKLNMNFSNGQSVEAYFKF